MQRLAPDALERLVKLLGMLGSNHAGERAAAGLKAHEFISQRGLQWSDIIAPAPVKIGWRDKVAACAEHFHHLNQVERSFIRTMLHWNGTPTDKQLSWLDRIFTNLPP